MNARFFAGVDIGGTKVAAGLVNELGEILLRTRTPMVANGDAAGGLEAVNTAIRELLRKSSAKRKKRKIVAVGICSPGPLDPKTGVVINPPNLPCWRNFGLAAEVQKTFKVPVKMDNDANAAALAEVLWGAGKGYRNVFYATIGTGIGTGIILDGKIFHGRTGAAAEGGHMGIAFDGPLCPCGKRGCVECLASGPAIARRARQKLRENAKSALFQMGGANAEAVTSEMVGKACTAGDPFAKDVIRETLDVLAYWLGNIVDLLEPEVIIMGGGVSAMLAPFFEEIRKKWKGAVLNPWPEEIPIVLAHYGEEAGIAGAAALCRTTD